MSTQSDSISYSSNSSVESLEEADHDSHDAETMDNDTDRHSQPAEEHDDEDDEDDEEDDDDDMDVEKNTLDPRKLHRHDIISYNSSLRSSLDDHKHERDDDDVDAASSVLATVTVDDDNDDNKSDMSKPELRNKLSRNLSEHLHWKKKSNKARVLRKQLEEEMESEAWISALQTCKKILDLQAFNFEPLYHFYCGFIYETGFSNYESAERHYRVALQLEQTSDKHIRYYARILRRLERYEQAQHVYEYGLEQHPDNHFIRYEYAYLLWLAQKYEEALSQLKYCLERDQQQQQSKSQSQSQQSRIGENVYWLYGRISCEMEEYHRASKYLQHSIDLKADDVGYRVDLMLYLIHNRQYKAADKCYRDAYALVRAQYPDWRPPPTSAGGADGGGGGDDQFKTPWQDTFSFVYLQSVYGYLLSLVGKKKRADQVFAELLHYNKNEFFEIHFYYALHLEFGLKAHDMALKQILCALVIEENWAVTYYYLAVVLYELALYSSALDFLNRAFKLNPSLPMIYKNFYAMIGKITKRLQWESAETEEDVHHAAVREYKRRNWSVACVLFLRLLEMNADNTNYQHNLAMVLYYGFDSHEAAEKFFRKSLKSCGSSHPDIIRHYAVLLVKQKRWEEAHAYFEILFKIVEKYKAQREQQLKDEEKKYAKLLSRWKRYDKAGGAAPPPPPQAPSVSLPAFNPSMVLSVDDHLQYALIAGDGLQLFEVAKEHLKQALKAKPEDGSIIGKYAVLLQHIGSYALSKEYFKHALTYIPKDLEVRYQFANLLWLMQDYASANEQLQTALNLIRQKQQQQPPPSTTTTEVKKSSSRLKLEEAEEKCCILYGIILIELESYEAAKPYILRAIDLNSSNKECLDIRYIAELMLLLIRSQHLDDALRYFEIASAYVCDQKRYFGNTIDDWYLQSVYALYCSRTQQFDAATQLYVELLSTKENETSPCYVIHFLYAQHLHYECGEYEQAEEQYIKAISIEDNWAITYWHYAHVLAKLQRYDAAETFLKQAHDMNDQIPSIGAHYESALQQLRADKMHSQQQQQQQHDEDERLMMQTLQSPTNATATTLESPSPQPRSHHHHHHSREDVDEVEVGIAGEVSSRTAVLQGDNGHKKKKKDKSKGKDKEKKKHGAVIKNALGMSKTRHRHHHKEKEKKKKSKRKSSKEDKERKQEQGRGSYRSRTRTANSNNNNNAHQRQSRARNRSVSNSQSKGNLHRSRRKSIIYASNSNLADDSSLDNLHKNIERHTKRHKKDKKVKKDKLTRDANKMYNARYNQMYGIADAKKQKQKRASPHSPNSKHASRSRKSLKSEKFEQLDAFYSGRTAQISQIQTTTNVAPPQPSADMSHAVKMRKKPKKIQSATPPTDSMTAEWHQLRSSGKDGSSSSKPLRKKSHKAHKSFTTREDLAAYDHHQSLPHTTSNSNSAQARHEHGHYTAAHRGTTENEFEAFHKESLSRKRLKQLQQETGAETGKDKEIEQRRHYKNKKSAGSSSNASKHSKSKSKGKHSSKMQTKSLYKMSKNGSSKNGKNRSSKSKNGVHSHPPPAHLEPSNHEPVAKQELATLSPSPPPHKNTESPPPEAYSNYPMNVNVSEHAAFELHAAAPIKHVKRTMQTDANQTHPVRTTTTNLSVNGHGHGHGLKRPKSGSNSKSKSNGHAPSNGNTDTRYGHYSNRNTKPLYNRKSGASAHSINSNGSRNSYGTRSITMMSASEEYSADQPTSGIPSKYNGSGDDDASSTKSY